MATQKVISTAVPPQVPAKRKRRVQVVDQSQIAAAHEMFFAYVFGLGEPGKDAPLSADDLAFLSELNISATN
jgi:hypothetical protein